MGSCRVAIVGAGLMAQEHARAFAALENVELVGIASRTRAKAEAIASEFSISTVAEGLGELYERSKPDLCVITVNIPSMREVVSTAFDYPWTLLVEKPVGLNYIEAKEISDLAIQKAAKAFVALNRRHYSSTRAAIADITSRENQRLIVVQDQQSIAESKEYGYPPEVVSNIMYGNSIHLIDYFTLFGRGDVVKVTPSSVWDENSTQFLTAQIEFSSGDLGVYEGVWNGPGPWSIAITDFARRWELRPVEQATFQNRGERKRNEVEVSPLDKTYKPGFSLQAQAAVETALGSTTCLPTLQDALKTMKLIRDVFSLKH